MQDLVTLPITGMSGWIVMRHLASFIASFENPFKRLMVFIGENTLYVFVFHIISYKIVSALKILWYDLEWGHIGSHMVIHYNNHEDLFWLLYTVIGVAVPLGVLYIFRRWRNGRPRLQPA